FGEPVTYVVQATSAVGGAPISQVELFANGELVHTEEGASATFQWLPQASGKQKLVAAATDEKGLSVFSTPLEFFVQREPVNTQLPPLYDVQVQTQTPTSAAITWAGGGDLPPGTVVVVERRLGDSDVWEEVGEVRDTQKFVDKGLAPET